MSPVSKYTEAARKIRTYLEESHEYRSLYRLSDRDLLTLVNQLYTGGVEGLIEVLDVKDSLSKGKFVNEYETSI